MSPEAKAAKAPGGWFTKGVVEERSFVVAWLRQQASAAAARVHAAAMDGRWDDAKRHREVWLERNDLAKRLDAKEHRQ